MFNIHLCSPRYWFQIQIQLNPKSLLKTIRQSVSYVFEAFQGFLSLIQDLHSMVMILYIVVMQVPNANVRALQHEGRPLEVTISLLSVETVDEKLSPHEWSQLPKAEVFNIEQQFLFQKYRNDRTATMAKIQELCALAVIKDESSMA